jgi:hypothetical protein
MTATPENHDAIVLGAGGGGLFAQALRGNGAQGDRARSCPEPGRKILISGGGRCNFTNIHASHERYLSANKHFARSALSRYTAADFLALVERYGIAWHERRWANCSAMVRRVKFWPCWSRNAGWAAWKSPAAWHWARSVMPMVCSMSVRGSGAFGAQSGDRDGRAFDPQDGGDRDRL